MTNGHRPDRQGWIYYALAASAHSMEVKIGFATEVRRRLRALRAETRTGQMPTLIAAERGTLADETRRHNKWRLQQLHGEWFTYAGPLRDAIGLLPDLVMEALHSTDPVTTPTDDPVVLRARTAAVDIAEAKREIAEALEIRDAAIRELADKLGPAAAARELGVSLSTVKLARKKTPTALGPEQ